MSDFFAMNILGGRTRKTAIVASGMLAQQISMFVTGVLIGRVLGASDFGTFTVLRNSVYWLLPLATVGLDLAVQKHATLGDGVGKFLPTYNLLRMAVLASNVAAVVAASIVALGWWGDHASALALVIVIASLPFMADTLLASGYMRAHDKLDVYSILTDFLQAALRIAIVGVAVGLGLASLNVMLGINTFVAVSVWIVLSFYLMRLNRKYPHASISQILGCSSISQASRLGREGIWMAASVLTYGTLRLADLWAVGLFATSAQLGAYAAISSVATFVRLVPLAISQSLGPQVAKLYEFREFVKIQSALRESMMRSSLAASFVLAGIAAFGPALGIVFGESFTFDPLVCFLLPLSWYVSSVLAPTGLVMSMTGQHRRETLLIVGGAVFLPILLLLLVPLLGVKGAAISSTLSFLAINLIRVWVAQKTLGLGLFTPRILIPTAIALVLAYICAWPSLAMEHRSLFAAIAGSVVYAIAYLGVAWWLWRLEKSRSANEVTN